MSEAWGPGRYVLVDVVATDPQGSPVTGLTKDDFQIFEKVDWVIQAPEKIADFRAGGKSAAPQTALPRTATATHKFPSASPKSRGEVTASGKSEATLTVLLLDDLNTDLFSPSVGEQVAGMADLDCDRVPVDPTCVTVPIAVMLLGPKLKMLQDFNSDRGVLRFTLHNAFAEKPSQTAGGPDSGATSAGAGENSVQADKASVSSLIVSQIVSQIVSPISSPIVSPVRNWDRLPSNLSARERRVQMTMDAIRAIARHLAGYPGRKRLIWVSSSFPFSIAPDPGANRFDDPLSYRIQAAEVTNALANGRVSVYPARPGLFPRRPSAGRSSANTSPAPHDQAEAAGIPIVASADYFAATAPMEEFAGQTGGEACIDDIDLADCFNRVLRHGLSDYEIVYAPTAADWKDGFHRIEVSTPVRSVHLDFHKYYYVRGEAPGGADMELKQAACDDLMTATSLKLTADFQSAPGERPKYLLAVDGKRLTADSLAGALASPGAGSLENDGPRLRSHLDFAVCTFDALGKPLQHVQYTAQQDMSSEEFKSVQRNGIRRLVGFQPVEATALVRWVVRDSLTGNLGSVDLPYVNLPYADPQYVDPQHQAPPSTVITEGEKTDHSAAPVAPAAHTSSDGVSEDVRPPEPDRDFKPYCSAIASQTEHSPALAELCQFTLSLPRKMPNVTCDLETRRHWPSFDGAHKDVVTATVSYEDGQERYSNIKVEGNPANTSFAVLNSSWSMGELAAILQTAFAPLSDAGFRFSKEVKLNSIPALVFEYRVDQSSNELYYSHAQYLSGLGVTFFPAYRGKVWLNKSNFQVMRMERETADMPASFPITRATTRIDYVDVPLGDGSDFVLPAKSDIEICSGQVWTECSHNVVRFKNWHKFRAKTRILSTEGSQ
ncbi:MAG: VWA domain-containing protein [Candidatus Sulfotelmatobacter sp.]